MLKKYLFYLLIVFMIFPALVFSSEISGDVFGKQRRHIHPALGLGFQYTDNLYNSSENKESDFSAVFSPSIAFAVPGTQDVDIVMNTDTGAPGGLVLSRDRIDSTDRYLAYLIYNPKGEYYFENDNENFVSHLVKGAAQYNSRGGLSIDLAGRYSASRETRGEVGNREADEYDDMLFDVILNYDITSKIFLKAGASRYNIEYVEGVSSFRDRADTSWSFSGGYKLSPKTKISIEYKNIDVDYYEDGLEDNGENIFSFNVSWDMTSRTKGKIKLGQSKKRLNSDKEAEEFFGELDMKYDFTTRTSLSLAASRKFYESNFIDADFYTSNRVALLYEQELTSKITCKFNLIWNGDNYSGANLSNNIYQINPLAEYEMTDWFSINCGYSYEKRESDLDILDYDTNSFYMSFNGQF